MARRPHVRLWIGTRKGAYAVESDARRRKWEVRGPFHAGRDIFHVVEDPRAPGTAYAAVNSGFFGPMLSRTTDGGHKWKTLTLPRITPHRGPQETPEKIVNLWKIVPGSEDAPKTIYLGIDPASLYRSDDAGKSWVDYPGINDHPTREKWNPGAGGLCLHTILIDPRDPKRMYVGISAAGTFRSDDAGEHWRPMNRGVIVSFQPERAPEFGQCVHHVEFDPADPRTLYRQDHDGIFVSHDEMEHWKRVGRPLPYDFGFGVAVARQRPGEAYFFPRTLEGSPLQIYRWADQARKWTALVRPGSFPGEWGSHREGLATDDLDPPGIYAGTTNGTLVYSADAGRTWKGIPYAFPGIHSVTARTLDLAGS